MSILKKNKFILGCIACILSASFQLNAQGIDFVHDLDSALVLAKAENKPIFIDFYTSWCAPCKVMTKDVFPQEKVGAFYNSRFINCKVQCDDNGKGVLAGEKYNVNAYPTLMFLDKNGTLIHSTAGGFPAEEFIDLGQIALNPEKNLLSLLTQWNNGKRDTAFVSKYFASLKSAYRTELAKTQFEDYFKGLSAADKVSRNTFEMIKLLGFGPFSPMFSFVESNQKKFYKNAGVEVVDKYIKNVYVWYFRGMAMNKGSVAQAKYQAEKALLKAKKYPFFDEVAMFAEVHEPSDTTGRYDIKEYMRKGTAFLDKYGANNDSYTISLSSLCGNFTGRENEGAAAIQWMEKLLARNPDPKYLTTYFYVLWRNQQFEKALQVGQQMRSNAVRNNESTKEIDDQLVMVTNYRDKVAKKKATGN